MRWGQSTRPPVASVVAALVGGSSDHTVASLATTSGRNSQVQTNVSAKVLLVVESDLPVALGVMPGEIAFLYSTVGKLLPDLFDP